MYTATDIAYLRNLRMKIVPRICTTPSDIYPRLIASSSTCESRMKIQPTYTCAKYSNLPYVKKNPAIYNFNVVINHVCYTV